MMMQVTHHRKKVILKPRCHPMVGALQIEFSKL
jgi:hypothetical protein